MAKYPYTIGTCLDKATLSWLIKEADDHYETLSGYVRHIILTYMNAKEARNKKGV